MVLYFIGNGFFASLYHFSDCIVLHSLFGATCISKVFEDGSDVRVTGSTSIFEVANDVTAPRMGFS